MSLKLFTITTLKKILYPHPPKNELLNQLLIKSLNLVRHKEKSFEMDTWWSTEIIKRQYSNGSEVDEDEKIIRYNRDENCFRTVVLFVCFEPSRPWGVEELKQTSQCSVYLIAVGTQQITAQSPWCSILKSFIYRLKDWLCHSESRGHIHESHLDLIESPDSSAMDKS